jgi:hypothetical protein
MMREMDQLTARSGLKGRPGQEREAYMTEDDKPVSGFGIPPWRPRSFQDAERAKAAKLRRQQLAAEAKAAKEPKAKRGGTAKR